MSKTDGKKIKRGAKKPSIFKRFGEGERSHSGDSARINYDASECFEYLIPGTVSEPTAGGTVTADVWLLCFDKGKLVHKERSTNRYNR